MKTTLIFVKTYDSWSWSAQLKGWGKRKTLFTASPWFFNQTLFMGLGGSPQAANLQKCPLPVHVFVKWGWFHKLVKISFLQFYQWQSSKYFFRFSI